MHWKEYILEYFTKAGGCVQKWPSDWTQRGTVKDITFLEFFPILVLITIWGTDFENKRVGFWSDNIAGVHVTNCQSSKSCRIMRTLILQCLNFNIHMGLIMV